MSLIDDIKKATEAGNLIIGTTQVTKKAKQGKIARILLSSNCPESVKADLSAYSVDVEELGVICKKPFSISVLGIASEE